jgi:hypothetical protein
MSNRACIACPREFSEEQLDRAVSRRAARTDPILMEYDPEDARRYPVCEDHGLKHLESPATSNLFRPSYFDPKEEDPKQDDEENYWDDLDQENARLKRAEAALKAAQNRVYFGKKAKRRKRR